MKVTYIIHKHHSGGDKTTTATDPPIIDALESQCCKGPVKTGEYPKLGITIVEVTP